MSSTISVVKRNYSVLKNDLAVGFGVTVPLTELGRKGRITNIQMRLDNTRAGARAVALYVADDALTAAPDQLDAVVVEEVVGLTGSATEVSFNKDYDRYYAVSAAGDLKVNLDFLAVDFALQSTVYVEVTAEVFG